MPITRILAVLLFILVLPLPAVSEENLPDVLADSRFTRDEQDDIRKIFNAARLEGIDDSLLLPRLQEAQAKRVSARRLLTALQKEVSLLIAARNILLETREGKKLLKETAPLPRTANLLSWGADQEEIQTIISAAGGDGTRYLDATYLFVSLIDWGLKRTNAEHLTVAAASSPINENDFPGVLNLLVRSRRGARTPEEQSDIIIGLISQVSDFSELEERMYYE